MIATSLGNQPPLIGKLLVLDSPDGESYTTSRFVTKVTKSLYRMKPCNPRTGEILHYGDFLIDVWSLMWSPDEEVIPRAKIFDSWEEFKKFDDDAPPAAVIKLVREK